MRPGCAGREGHQSDEGQEAVDEQQLVAEVIVEAGGGQAVDSIAEQGRGHADDGHQAVAHAATREEAEGEESEQGTVGIADDGVDGVDERRAACGAEQEDEDDEEQAYREVGALAQRLVGGPLADVDAVARRQRRQGRVGRRERGGDDAEREEDGHRRARSLDEGGQKLVALGGQPRPAALSQLGQQHAEGQEQEVGRQEGQPIAAHVFLGVAQRAAGQVLLHHVLVEPRHDDDDEGAAEQLFPEIRAAGPVVEDEDAAAPVGHDGLQGFAEVETQLTHDHIYNKEERGEETRRLQHIGEHERAHPTPPRIEPDERHHRHGVDPEGHAEGVEHKRLEDHADDVELDGRPHQLRQQEEPSAAEVGAAPQTLTQVGID